MFKIFKDDEAFRNMFKINNVNCLRGTKLICTQKYVN